MCCVQNDMCAFIFRLPFVVFSTRSHLSHNTVNKNNIHVATNNFAQPPRIRARNQASAHTSYVGGSKSRES